jgi:hypothetical protein
VSQWNVKDNGRRTKHLESASTGMNIRSCDSIDVRNSTVMSL